MVLLDRVTWRKSAFATLSDERTNQREELKMIPLVLILAVTAALTLVIVIAARRSPSNVSRAGDTRLIVNLHQQRFRRL